MNRRCYFFAGTWSESPVSTHIRAMSDELVRRGHQVVFIVDKRNVAAENRESNPAIYTWPSARPTKIADALFLRKLIKQYRPDCLFAAFGSTNVMLSVGWLMRVPTRVVWYLTMADAISIDGQIKRWKLRILKIRKRLIYRLATHVVPNSVAGLQDAHLVYGVPTEKCNVLYLSLPDPKLELKDLELTHDVNRTICVGRLHPTKGQDVLLKAIARLKEDFPNTIFEFVGDGPCREECERIAEELGISERCRFLGRLPHDEVLRRMAAASVSIVPSRSECFGLVNIESMAMGTPVIASNVGGIGEIFNDGEEGFLVPPDDPTSLALRLAEVLGNPQLRHMMSGKAQLRFQDFEQNNVVSRQVDWIETLNSNQTENAAN
ncbi:glycosyltransferase family 4 protein [Novipirellula sp. SH528]|uniref:glycosyltransferase family 4 protein n=1 Tax=Novipirellula sp. SH528 TaxID=3454466 RepID=UPI003F9EF6C7